MTTRRKLLMYTRAGCGLCEEMRSELAPWLRNQGASLALVSVDSDPVLRQTYGERIPVLLLDGEEICWGRLELDLLDEAWFAGR